MNGAAEAGDLDTGGPANKDAGCPYVRFLTKGWNFRLKGAFPRMTDPSKSHPRPIVVVVAEDEMLLRMIAVEALTEEGFIAIEAGHATAALEVCKSRANEIDVLFTDIRMPGSMDGLELAHRVRERWPQISVLIASGNLFVPADELPAGASFLPKPYDMRRVVHVIREMRRTP
jgi:two-component system, response regulator PdtaR